MGGQRCALPRTHYCNALLPWLALYMFFCLRSTQTTISHCCSCSCSLSQRSFLLFLPCFVLFQAGQSSCELVCTGDLFWSFSPPLSLSFGPSPPPSLFVLDWANASGVILSPPCFCLLHLDSLWGITKVLSDPVRLGPVCPPL